MSAIEHNLTLALPRFRVATHREWMSMEENYYSRASCLQARESWPMEGTRGGIIPVVEPARCYYVRCYYPWAPKKYRKETWRGVPLPNSQENWHRLICLYRVCTSPVPKCSRRVDTFSTKSRGKLWMNCIQVWWWTHMFDVQLHACAVDPWYPWVCGATEENLDAHGA
jgi:hypothetical protein